MKGRFALTPRAQIDLDEIWNYTEHCWGRTQAETYVRQLWADIQTIADNPLIGRECAEVRAGYRQFPSGSHILFYRQTTGGIDVVRILHGRMDYQRHPELMRLLQSALSVPCAGEMPGSAAPSATTARSRKRMGASSPRIRCSAPHSRRDPE